jgi:broad specificity phosphatase PhoE
VSHVWTSTYARAVQTAEIAAAHLGVGVTTREGLRELTVDDHHWTCVRWPPEPD